MDYDEEGHKRHKNWVRMECIAESRRLLGKTDISSVIECAKDIQRFVLDKKEAQIIPLSCVCRRRKDVS